MLNMSLLDLIESSKFMLCVALYTANMLTGLEEFECWRSAVLLEVSEGETLASDGTSFAFCQPHFAQTWS